jgi:probable HAF family extracellular repeat protein
MNTSAQIVGGLMRCDKHSRWIFADRQYRENIDDPNAATGTTIVWDINDKGEMVGKWEDSSMVTHAFWTKDGVMFNISTIREPVILMRSA